MVREDGFSDTLRSVGIVSKCKNAYLQRSRWVLRFPAGAAMLMVNVQRNKSASENRPALLIPPTAQTYMLARVMTMRAMRMRNSWELAMLLRLRRLFRAVGRDIVVLWYACRNPATPALLKLGAVLLALYIISPVDLIPDWLVVLGWIDDVTLLALGIPALLRLVPPHALDEARMSAEGLLSKAKF
jgi:uncharacterized membrane protein YkvA (DUF1232 family)